MHDNFYRKVMLGTLQELLPHLPYSYSIKIIGFIPDMDGPSHFAASIHSNQIIEYEGAHSELPRMVLRCGSEQFRLVHTYYLPDDWPYRSMGCYQREYRYDLADPGFLDQVIALVASVADDPQTKTICWEHRKLSDSAREARRQSIIKKARAAGHIISDQLPMARLREFC